MTDVLEPEAHEVDVVFTPDVELVEGDGAHIIFPWVEVGEKALTLCGKKHKVRMEWTDIPPEYPICRECVDVALVLLSDSARAQNRTMLLATDLTDATRNLADHLAGGSSLLEVIDTSLSYQDRRAEKAIAKAEAKAEAESEPEAGEKKSKKKSKKKGAKKE
jgi:hypothetical protein